MGNPNDLYADSILLDASLPAVVDTGSHAVANSTVAAYG